MLKKENQLAEAAAVIPKNGNVGLLVKIIIFFTRIFQSSCSYCLQKGIHTGVLLKDQ